MIVILPLLVLGGGGKTLTISVFKRLSLVSCAVILSLSNVSMADETTALPPQPEREKAYTLTRVEAEGENTITKIELNTETGKFEPVYYRLDLIKTEYGEGDQSKTFTLTNEPVKGVEITARYDNSNLQTRLENTTDNSSMTIVGSFIEQTDNYKGGAILNDKGAKLGNIEADFIGNYVNHYRYEGALGGAIYNQSEATIGDITGDFVGNYAYASRSSFAAGGAIYNEGTLGNITGNFIGNYAFSEGGASSPSGGAIFNLNDSIIGNITGDFIGNYIAGDYVEGGAIYNHYGAEIGDIAGDFIENYALGSDSAYGGAIYNYGSTSQIGNITGNFVGNSAQGDYEVYGGAIYNGQSGRIADIAGNFSGNYAVGANAAGGAIYNLAGAEIGNIAGDFTGNYVQGNEVCGGAIYNRGYVGTTTGNFVNNYAQGDMQAWGGAIYNNNYIWTTELPTIDIVSITYTNSKTGESVRVYDISTSDLTWLEDAVKNGYKVAISSEEYTVEQSEWDNIESDIKDGYYSQNLPINDNGIINEDDVKFVQDSAITFLNSSFINNRAESQNGTALGGAIFSQSKLSVVADNGISVFSGNKTISQGKEEQNAIALYGKYGIYDAPKPASLILTNEMLKSEEETPGFLDSNYEKVAENTAELELKAVNNGVILFDDTIRGGAININTGEIMETPETAYKLKITGDKTGKVVFNNSVINAKATLDEVTLHLTKADILASSTLTANSGHLSLLNGLAETQSMQGMTVNGHLGMSVDVDLANKSMDRLPENVTTVAPDGKIDVEYLNLLNDAKEDRTDILFAEESYKDKVSYTGKSPVAYSPIYKYDVSYNQDDGFFTFLRSSGGGNPSDAFNPTVLAPSVAAQAGAYATQMNTFNYAFQHSDNFMNLPFLERLALKESGRYASTTTNSFSPLYTRIESAGYWVKPYVSFESIPLKNGPKVDNINYGSLIGYDSKITPIAHGFDRVLSGYVGYNGANQSYSGVDSYQNGGLVGGTIFLYKGNFFNATTLSVGASVGESQNMYGNENYTMLLAGIGNRLGYNFEFKEGRYIIQPSMLMSYTFVNTFDYTNSAGVRMESDPLHAIQLAPGVKFIMNTKNGWQPYAAVNMVWNVLDKSDVRANDVRLPEMSIKPYVQYGLGVQKRIKDRFLAFGQAMVSNGGRNGVSLSFGLRWFLGGGK